MFRRTVSLLLAIPLFAALPAVAAEHVALRAANGRFLHVGDDGALRAEAVLPADKETFELVVRGKQEIALKSPGGRYVVLDAKDARLLRLDPAGTAPGGRETFQLVPVEANRFALRPRGTAVAPVLSPAEGVEIFRIRPLPSALPPVVSLTVQTLVTTEVTGKQYDQTRTHHTNRCVELPAPTRKDPKHKKRIQVLAMTEEYRVQARLDGDAGIRIPTMLYLRNYAEGGPGAILVALDARLPVTGRVWGTLPDVASASTGYRAMIRLSAVVESRVQRSGNGVTFGPYTVSDLHVAFERLDFSNDLLKAARRPIRDCINRELARNEERLRQTANQALEKAMSSRAVRIPLLGYLGLP